MKSAPVEYYPHCLLLYFLPAYALMPANLLKSYANSVISGATTLINNSGIALKDIRLM
jgi:hypothetical protein